MAYELSFSSALFTDRLPNTCGPASVQSVEDLFVGREREMTVLQARLGDACAGRGQLVLLAGEPGIGKSRLATELAAYARLRNVKVLIGRCYEGEGASPFWPWVQIVRSYVSDADPAALSMQMGAGAADIARVISEVRERLPDLPVPFVLEPAEARFRFFDSLTLFLKTAAVGQTLVLVLDDLQWADKPSLLLLQFLARELGDARLLVIGTYRDAEPRREHLQTLGEIACAPGVQSLPLQGLTESEVSRFFERTTGAPAPEALIAAVYRQTDGNPFFLTEVARLLMVEEGPFSLSQLQAAIQLPIPQRVRAVISRRLQHLSADCHRVLTVASVIGREFGVTVLKRVSDLSGTRVVDALAEALAARVIGEVPDSAGHYRFVHVLIRETVYEGLSLADRIRLHRRVGEVLEEADGAGLGLQLTELAHHFFVAAQGGDGVDKAVEYSARAGARAIALLAYEEAVSHYERALQLLGLMKTDEARRCELLLTLGEARHGAGGAEKARAAFEQAARVAQSLDAGELLARAALGVGIVRAETGVVDAVLVELLEAALVALGDGLSALRAKVLARLAVALYFSRAEERRLSLSMQALVVAQWAGDPGALASALLARHFTLWGPGSATERLAIADEIIRLAEEAGAKKTAIEGQAWKILDLLELGDIDAVDREIDSYTLRNAEFRSPRTRWHLLLVRATRALLAGQFEVSERLATEAAAVPSEGGELANAAQFFAVQMFTLRREQGRLAELEPAVISFAEQFPALPIWRCGRAILHSDLGNREAARREFEHLAARDFAELPRDANWLPALAVLAEVCAFLGDSQRAAMLYTLLHPYAERNIVVATSAACYGSAARYLGLLAAVRSRWEEAEEHFQTALQFNKKMGARPLVAHTQYDYARMLLAHGEPYKWENAWELLTQALDTAQSLGMSDLVKKVLALQVEAQSRATKPGEDISHPAQRKEETARQETNLFRREGDYWTIAHQQTECRLRHIRGLDYIAHLLQNPNREFYVLDLVNAARKTALPSSSVSRAALQESGLRVSGLGDAGELLDHQARAAYKQRLADLQEELQEAQAFNDPARATKMQQEIDFLLQELAIGMGLGGRNRTAASQAERARINVTRGIKAALAKISEHSPTLELYLATTVKTGLFCSFTPDPRLPVAWQF